MTPHFDRRAELADAEWFRRNPEQTERTRPATLAERLRHRQAAVVIVGKRDICWFTYEFEGVR